MKIITPLLIILYLNLSACSGGSSDLELPGDDDSAGSNEDATTVISNDDNTSIAVDSNAQAVNFQQLASTTYISHDLAKAQGEVSTAGYNDLRCPTGEQRIVINAHQIYNVSGQSNPSLMLTNKQIETNADGSAFTNNGFGIDSVCPTIEQYPGYESSENGIMEFYIDLGTAVNISKIYDFSSCGGSGMINADNKWELFTANESANINFFEEAEQLAFNPYTISDKWFKEFSFGEQFVSWLSHDINKRIRYIKVRRTGAPRSVSQLVICASADEASRYEQTGGQVNLPSQNSQFDQIFGVNGFSTVGAGPRDNPHLIKPIAKLFREFSNLRYIFPTYSYSGFNNDSRRHLVQFTSFEQTRVSAGSAQTPFDQIATEEHRKYFFHQELDKNDAVGEPVDHLIAISGIGPYLLGQPTAQGMEITGNAVDLVTDNALSLDDRKAIPSFYCPRNTSWDAVLGSKAPANCSGDDALPGNTAAMPDTSGWGSATFSGYDHYVGWPFSDIAQMNSKNLTSIEWGKWLVDNFNNEILTRPNLKLSENPFSYIAHAKLITDTTYLYNSLVPGRVVHIENSNEPDKDWLRIETADGLVNNNEGTHTPEEYAAMSSADYDGHCGAMTDHEGNPIGFVHAVERLNGLQPKFVMAAIYKAENFTSFILRMSKWFEENRTAPGCKVFPFDALNIHIYPTVTGGQYSGSSKFTFATHPEFVDANFTSTNMQVAHLKDYIQAKFSLPALELWNTEFGVDSEHMYNSPDIVAQEIPKIWQWYEYGVQAMNNQTSDPKFNAFMQDFLNTSSPNYLNTVCGALTDICYIAPDSARCQQHKDLMAAADRSVWTAGGIQVESTSFVRVPYRNIVNNQEYIYQYGARPSEIPFKQGTWVDEIQGQWIVRSYLELFIAGIDKGAVYWMSDSADLFSSVNSGTFFSSGMVETAIDREPVCYGEGDNIGCFCGGQGFYKNKPKPVWYYLNILRNELTGMQMDVLLSSINISDEQPIRLLKLKDSRNDNRFAYIAWIADGRSRLDESFDDGGDIYPMQTQQPLFLKHTLNIPEKITSVIAKEIIRPNDTFETLHSELPEPNTLTSYSGVSHQVLIEEKTDSSTDITFRVGEMPVIIFIEKATTL